MSLHGEGAAWGKEHRAEQAFAPKHYGRLGPEHPTGEGVRCTEGLTCIPSPHPLHSRRILNQLGQLTLSLDVASVQAAWAEQLRFRERVLGLWGQGGGHVIGGHNQPHTCVLEDALTPGEQGVRGKSRQHVRSEPDRAVSNGREEAGGPT